MRRRCYSDRASGQLIPLIQERLKVLTEARASRSTGPSSRRRDRLSTSPRQLIGKKLDAAQSAGRVGAGLELMESVEPFSHRGAGSGLPRDLR